MFGSNVMKITKQQGCLAWDVDLTDAKKKQEVKIENGIQCVRFVDGIKVDSLYATTAKTVLDCKEGATRLIAVDINGVHNIRCGCGGVSFTDYEINMEGSVGMNATISVKVVNAMRFVDNFLETKKVSDEVAEDFFRDKFKQAMSFYLKEAVNQFGKNAEDQIFTLNNQLKAYLQPEIQKLGLSIENFQINNIHFSEEYEQARKDYFEKKEQDRLKKKEQREAQEEQDRELDVLERISKMGGKKDQQKDNEGVYCSVCGHKNRVGVAFCEKCGNKIK